jgi:DNA-binding transcriptional LysR family regulator
MAAGADRITSGGWHPREPAGRDGAAGQRSRRQAPKHAIRQPSVPAASPLQYYLVCHPERHAEPAIVELRDWLRETARSTVADLPALIERGAKGR